MAHTVEEFLKLDKSIFARRCKKCGEELLHCDPDNYNGYCDDCYFGLLGNILEGKINDFPTYSVEQLNKKSRLNMKSEHMDRYAMLKVQDQNG